MLQSNTQNCFYAVLKQTELNVDITFLYISYILVSETQNSDPLAMFTGIGVISSNIQEVIQ